MKYYKTKTPDGKDLFLSASKKIFDIFGEPPLATHDQEITAEQFDEEIINVAPELTVYIK